MNDDTYDTYAVNILLLVFYVLNLTLAYISLQLSDESCDSSAQQYADLNVATCSWQGKGTLQAYCCR